jgi:2-methylisocitrate lyase-like PEP mutase family enzyme
MLSLLKKVPFPFGDRVKNWYRNFGRSRFSAPCTKINIQTYVRHPSLKAPFKPTLNILFSCSTECPHTPQRSRNAVRRSRIGLAVTASGIPSKMQCMLHASTSHSFRASHPSSLNTRCRLKISCAAHSANGAERAAALRSLLARPRSRGQGQGQGQGLLLGPAAYDGISARLTEEAGFDFAFMSGFSVSAALLGKPDVGLATFTEMLEQGRHMNEATRSLPIIGDADTGYGDVMNVKRTVAGYAAAGFAGILIEDQEWPKSCGHVGRKTVVSREEAFARIKAACDARDESPYGNIVIVARTDARQAISFEEALLRCHEFAKAGADVVFIDALETKAEMRTFCVAMRTVGVYTMANMLEGGGKTPILTPEELEEMGFSLCAFPLSLLGASIAGMQSALEGLKRGEISSQLPSFSKLQEIVGFPEYFEEAKTYSDGFQVQQPESQPVVPDAVLDPDQAGSFASSPISEINTSSGTIDLFSSRDEKTDDSEDRRSQWLRIKISDGASGMVKLDTRFPAGFLGSVAAIVPQVAGLDLQALLKGEWEGRSEDGMKRPTPGSPPSNADKPIFTFEADGDSIEIYLETR